MGDALNAATALTDISPLNRVGLHKLKGDRRGQWALDMQSQYDIALVERAHGKEIAARVRPASRAA